MENLWELRPPLVGEKLSEPADQPAGQSADSIAGSVEHAIRRRTDGQIRQLRVEVTPCTLLLHGYSATFHLKQIAQHAAMGPGRGPRSGQPDRGLVRHDSAIVLQNDLLQNVVLWDFSKKQENG